MNIHSAKINCNELGFIKTHSTTINTPTPASKYILSVYFWFALMLSLTASSGPKHTWATCFRDSWPFHFILLIRRILQVPRRLVLCFSIWGFKRWAWVVIAPAWGYCTRWEWAARDRAEKIRRSWRDTGLAEIRMRRRRWWVRITCLKHAWGA